MSTRAILDEVIGFWRELMFPRDLKRRDIELPLNTRNVVVITGVRRSGKTYLMFQTIKDLLDKGVREENIFYINFEDERIEPRTEYLTELIPTIRERYTTSEDIYLFLDEVHRIPKWDLWINRQHARGRRIYISGSTSKLKPDQIPRSLRGRTETYVITPLSFREFLKFKGLGKTRIEKIRSEESKSMIMGLLLEYMEFGGFPQIVLMKDKHRKMLTLQEYYRTIMYRDILDGGNIENETLLDFVLKYLMSAPLFSSTKIIKVLKSIGVKTSKNTILKYKKEIEKSYMLTQVKIFSKNIKDQTQYPKKMYCIDQGLRRAISREYRESLPLTLENTIFVEIWRRKKIAENIHYWKSPLGEEVDFVVEENMKPKNLIQVTYIIENEKTRKREEKALLKAMKELKVSEGIIVTWNEEKTERKGSKIIRYIPAWKYLMQQ
ncbi:MAG: ATP-binding protein [Candidatus Njordarchaeia archaeon]